MILDETVTCPILPEQSSSARPAAYNLLPPLAVRASLLSASPLAPIQDNGEWREKWREQGELASGDPLGLGCCRERRRASS